MIIVITPEQILSTEVALVHQLFEAGLEKLHIRKYSLSDQEVTTYIQSIDRAYHERLVLHDHFHLAKQFGIRNLHFREEERLQHGYESYKQEYKLSTSTHTIADFDALDSIWQYAFLSPVFPSISKQGYGNEHTVLNEMKNRKNNTTKLLGLGGVTADNYEQVRIAGANGAALLGSIWHQEHPIQTLLACKKIDQLY